MNQIAIPKRTTLRAVVNPTKTTASFSAGFYKNMTKNWERHARFSQQRRGDIDVDYHTGRKLQGDWVPLPSEEPRDRFNAPLPGAPLLLVNQWDKAIVPE
jgi:hypothetical protein